MRQSLSEFDATDLARRFLTRKCGVSFLTVGAALRRDGALWNGSRPVLQKVPSSFAIVADPTGAGTEKPPRVVEIEGKPVAFKYDAASGRLSATLPAAALGEGWGSGAGVGVPPTPPKCGRRNVAALERSDNVAGISHAFAMLKRGYIRRALPEKLFSPPIPTKPKLASAY